jgi:hypothetical protein
MGSMQDMMGMMGMGGMRQRQSLTDDQKKQVTSILSQYDANNITASDAKAIFKAFEEAGITPAKGLKETIEAAGFDAEKLRSLAMPDRQGMGRPQAMELSEDQQSQVLSILSKYDPENITAEDAKSIFSQFSDVGIQPMKGLKEAIESAGFDAEKLVSLAMPKDNAKESMFWATQNSTQSINLSSLQSLQSILDQYDFSNMSSDQETTLFTQLINSGLLQGGSYLNIGA